MKNNTFLLFGLLILLSHNTDTLTKDQVGETAFEFGFNFKFKTRPSSFLPLIGGGSALYALWKTKAFMTEKAPTNASPKELLAYKVERARSKKRILGGLLVSAASFAVYGLVNSSPHQPQF